MAAAARGSPFGVRIERIVVLRTTKGVWVDNFHRYVMLLSVSGGQFDSARI